ncbi:MAG: hypothetical protein AABY22_26780 [Nanoarchaeota archaeon]
MNKLKEKMYNLMDSFLVEGDKPRPIDRLNIDRHLFVKNLFQLFKDTVEKVIPPYAPTDYPRTPEGRQMSYENNMYNSGLAEFRQNLSKILTENEVREME